MPPARKRRSLSRKRIGNVSLYLHHGGWWVYYREHGAPVRRRVGNSREEAERVAADVNAQLTSAAPTVFSFVPVTVADLRRRFLEYHEDVRRSSLATISRYAAATNHLLEFEKHSARNRPAHEIAVTRFTSFLRSRTVSPNGHQNTCKRLLRDKGVQYILETCRSMYAFAAQQRHLPPYMENPFKTLGLDRMRIEDAKPIFVFDSATEMAFFQAADDWEFAVHFCLAKTGLRPGELCRLMIEDLDLEGGWVRIRNQPELGWSTKTRTERSVPLIPELRAVLKRVIGGRSAGPVILRKKFADTARAGRPRAALISAVRAELVHQERLAQRPLTRVERARAVARIWHDSGAVEPDRIRISFIRVAHRCGLTMATCPKSWRHTFATLLQDANVDPLLRQITLGHRPAGSSGALGMTAVYTHSRPETQAREIERALRAWPQSLSAAALRAQGSSHVRE